jgi:NAD(P) transhydrogenase
VSRHKSWVCRRLLLDEELVHIGQIMIVLGGTVETLSEMVFNYSTLSECYKYPAYDALGRLAMPGHKTEEADGS